MVETSSVGGEVSTTAALMRLELARVGEALPTDCLVVTAGALGDVSVVGAEVMDPEELGGAVAEDLLAAGTEVGDRREELLGCRRRVLVEVIAAHDALLQVKSGGCAINNRASRHPSRPSNALVR